MVPLKRSLKERCVRAAALTGAAFWGIASIFGFLEGFVSLAVARRYDADAYAMLTHRVPVVENDASIIALICGFATLLSATADQPAAPIPWVTTSARGEYFFKMVPERLG